MFEGAGLFFLIIVLPFTHADPALCTTEIITQTHPDLERSEKDANIHSNYEKFLGVRYLPRSLPLYSAPWGDFLFFPSCWRLGVRGDSSLLISLPLLRITECLNKNVQYSNTNHSSEPGLCPSSKQLLYVVDEQQSWMAYPLIWNTILAYFETLGIFLWCSGFQEKHSSG